MHAPGTASAHHSRRTTNPKAQTIATDPDIRCRQHLDSLQTIHAHGLAGSAHNIHASFRSLANIGCPAIAYDVWPLIEIVSPSRSAPHCSSAGRCWAGIGA